MVLSFIFSDDIDFIFELDLSTVLKVLQALVLSSNASLNLVLLINSSSFLNELYDNLFISGEIWVHAPWMPNYVCNVGSVAGLIVKHASDQVFEVVRVLGLTILSLFLVVILPK